MRTALHLFAGSGGCTLGFKLAGFDNAIPVKAAQAIGEAAMRMLEAADAGFQLVGGGDIWVREGAEA